MHSPFPSNPEAARLITIMMASKTLHVQYGFPRHRVVRLLALCSCWILTMGGGQVRAESSGVAEYVLKAGYIAKFPDFVKWPSPSSSVTVGILGDDPFGAALAGIMKVKRSKNVEDLKGCQIVFISKSERGNLAGIIAALAGANVMTVGDSDGFARQGGVLGFIMVGDKVRFEINTGAAKRAGIKIDTGLLSLASKVIKS